MSDSRVQYVDRDELQVLQTFRWPEGLATSCYLYLDGRQLPKRASVATVLSSMHSQAKADLERRAATHQIKASVLDDLRNLEDWIENHLPERSGAQTLAWFSCSAQDIQIPRWLPVPLPNRLVLAEDFDNSALLGVLRSVPQVGLVVIDHAVTRIYHADVSRVVEAATLEPDMQPHIRPRETQFGAKARMPDIQFGRGNIQERRIHNRRNQMLHRHIEQIVPRLSRMARENGWSHLLISGEVRSVSQLRNHLTADLRRLDVQVVDLPAKVDAAGVKTFLHGKMDDLRHQRFHHEYDAITGTPPQMRATGLAEVCRAAAGSAVQMLLLESAAPREGKVCNQCGWLGLLDSRNCPVCQTELIQSPHIYDNLADAVLGAGGDVLFSEIQVLPPNVEHVVARLRFPVSEGL